MIAAAANGGVDTTVFAAFAVGFVSFISPCVLPLVPGYLSAISGVSLEDIRGEERPLGKILGPALIFCLSFTIMFVALGMSATGIGSTLHDHQDTLNRIAGWLIVVLGVFFVCTLFIPRFNREWRLGNLCQLEEVTPAMPLACHSMRCAHGTLGSLARRGQGQQARRCGMRRCRPAFGVKAFERACRAAFATSGGGACHAGGRTRRVLGASLAGGQRG